MASPTQSTWVWANSGTWWRTGKPGVLQSMGLQRVRQDWVTEQVVFSGQIKVTSSLQGYLHWLLRNSLLDLLAYRYSVPGHVNIHSKRPLEILSQPRLCFRRLSVTLPPLFPLAYWTLNELLDDLCPSRPTSRLQEVRHPGLLSLTVRNHRSISMGHQRWSSILVCPSQACFYYWKCHESGSLTVLGKLRP